jgi:hypothetical protein
VHAWRSKRVLALAPSSHAGEEQKGTPARPGPASTRMRGKSERMSGKSRHQGAQGPQAQLGAVAEHDLDPEEDDDNGNGTGGKAGHRPFGVTLPGPSPGRAATGAAAGARVGAGCETANAQAAPGARVLGSIRRAMSFFRRVAPGGVGFSTAGQADIEASVLPKAGSVPAAASSSGAGSGTSKPEGHPALAVGRSRRNVYGHAVGPSGRPDSVLLVTHDISRQSNRHLPVALVAASQATLGTGAGGGHGGTPVRTGPSRGPGAMVEEATAKWMGSPVLLSGRPATSSSLSRPAVRSLDSNSVGGSSGSGSGSPGGGGGAPGAAGATAASAGVSAVGGPAHTGRPRSTGGSPLAKSLLARRMQPPPLSLTVAGDDQSPDDVLPTRSPGKEHEIVLGRAGRDADSFGMSSGLLAAGGPMEGASGTSSPHNRYSTAPQGRRSAMQDRLERLEAGGITPGRNATPTPKALEPKGGSPEPAGHPPGGDLLKALHERRFHRQAVQLGLSEVHASALLGLVGIALAPLVLRFCTMRWLLGFVLRNVVFLVACNVAARNGNPPSHRYRGDLPEK